MPIDFVFDGPANAASVVALAHGAGAAMDTPFMSGVAERLATAGIRVARFEFPYMAQRRSGGRHRPPDRPAVLLGTWHDVVVALTGAAGKRPRLFVAGKSMGGRYASLHAAAGTHRSAISGVICLGYPFHPPGKPEQLRIDHLSGLAVPMLIVQGERDPFGGITEVSGYRLPRGVRVEWSADGDHSLKPRKSSGHTEAGNLDLACRQIAAFVSGMTGTT